MLLLSELAAGAGGFMSYLVLDGREITTLFGPYSMARHRIFWQPLLPIDKDN
jgi:hypothetical protein